MNEWRKYVLSYIWGSALIAQILLVFVFGRFNEAGWNVLFYLGWVIWAISVLFGFLPMFTLKRKGGVTKGKSYVHTHALVDSGIYAIIRHPQYMGGVLFSLALILWAQEWLVICLGLIVILLLYIDIFRADRYEIEKFGDDYKRYMEKVPGTNFLLGLFRLILKLRKG